MTLADDYNDFDMVIITTMIKITIIIIILIL